MKKLESIEEALIYLKAQEILCTKVERNILYFSIREEKIRVKGENSSYIVSLDDFLTLYQKCVFYIWEKEEDASEIDKEKDEEYYGWWHK